MDTNDYYYLNLNILSQIEENDKLGLTSINNNIKLIVDKFSYISPITRYYNGYNRNDVIDYLKDFTNRLEKYIELLVKGNLTDYNETIIPIIKNSLKGLDNLKNTYSSDSNIVSELSLIIIKFNNFINQLNNINYEDNDDN